MKKIFILLHIVVFSLKAFVAFGNCTAETPFKDYDIIELGDNKVKIYFYAHNWKYDYNLSNVEGSIDFGNGFISHDITRDYTMVYDKTKFLDNPEILVTLTYSGEKQDFSNGYSGGRCNDVVSEIVYNVTSNDAIIVESLYDVNNPDNKNGYSVGDTIDFGVKISGFNILPNDQYLYKILDADHNQIVVGNITGSNLLPNGYELSGSSTIVNNDISYYTFELYQYDFENMISYNTLHIRFLNDDGSNSSSGEPNEDYGIKTINGKTYCSCNEPIDYNMYLSHKITDNEVSFGIIDDRNMEAKNNYKIYEASADFEAYTPDCTPGHGCSWHYSLGTFDLNEDPNKVFTFSMPSEFTKREYGFIVRFHCYGTKSNGDLEVKVKDRLYLSETIEGDNKDEYTFPNTGGTNQITIAEHSCLGVEIKNTKNKTDDFEWIESININTIKEEGNYDRYTLDIVTKATHTDKNVDVKLFKDFTRTDYLKEEKFYREINVKQNHLYADNYTEGAFVSIPEAIRKIDESELNYDGYIYGGIVPVYNDFSGIYEKPYSFNIDEVYKQRLSYGADAHENKETLNFYGLEASNGEMNVEERIGSHTILRYNECISKSSTGYYDYESWTDSDWYDKEKFIGQEHDIYMYHIVREDRVLDSSNFELYLPGDEKVKIITANNKVVLSGKSGKLRLARGGRFYAGINPLCELKHNLDDAIVSVSPLSSQSQKSATISNTVSRDTAHHDIVYHDIELTYNEVADKEKSSFLVKVYPNPSEGRFILDISGFDSVHGELNILSTDGKIVHTQNNITDPVIELDISHVPQGIYVIYFASEGTLYTNNIIKY